MRRHDPIPELKRQLAAALARAIAGWTPGELIYRMRIDQPRVSDVWRGQLERISAERLIRWLSGMGYRVELTVIDARGERRQPRDA